MNKINKTQIIIGLGILVIFAGILIYANASFKNKNESLEGEIAKPLESNNGKVVLEEYSDFQCPACAQASQIVDELKDKYPNKLEVVFQDTPFHKYSILASEAAQCANDQGKYWEYHDLLFQNQSIWGQSLNEKEAIKHFKEYAKSLGLNTEQFNKSLDSGEKKSYVNEKILKAQALKISATPTFYLNGKKLQNYKTWDELVGMIEKELK